MLNSISDRCHRTVVVCAPWLFLCAQLQAQNPRADVVKIQVDPKTTLSRISADFMAFGYETSAVAQSNFFGAKNVTLVQLYRNLSPHGLIRLGGNVSDHTKYVPEGEPAVRTDKEVTIINRANLADLGDFARATGWKVMWGLNLGSGPEKRRCRRR